MSIDRNSRLEPDSSSPARSRIPFVNRIIPEIGLTARLGAAGEGGDVPPGDQPRGPHEHPEDGEGTWVTCWAGGRPLAKSRMDDRLARALCQSAFFQGEATVSFMGLVPPVRPDWIRLDVLGLPDRTPQFDALLHLYAWTQGNVSVGHAGHGRVGIRLGRHWVRYPEAMRAGFERGDPEVYRDFTGLVDELIIRLLTGGPEEVEGKFRSVKLSG